jgi:hypothetical protein
LGLCGAGTVPPVTLAELTLSDDGGMGFYYVSLVDGFKVPIEVRKFLREHIKLMDSVLRVYTGFG